MNMPEHSKLKAYFNPPCCVVHQSKEAKCCRVHLKISFFCIWEFALETSWCKIDREELMAGHYQASYGEKPNLCDHQGVITAYSYPFDWVLTSKTLFDHYLQERLLGGKYFPVAKIKSSNPVLKRFVYYYKIWRLLPFDPNGHWCYLNKLAKLGNAIAISKSTLNHWPTDPLTDRGRC